MAVSFIAASSGGGSGGGSISRPTGQQENDVIVASVALQHSDRDIVPPAGWTELQVQDPNSAFSSEYSAWYIVVGASPPASDSWTTGTTPLGAVLGLFRGVDTASPIEDSALAAGQVIPSVTSAGDSMLVGLMFGDGGTDYTADAAMTEALDLNQAVDQHMAYQVISSAGATGTRTPTFDGTKRAGIAVLLKAAGGGGGGGGQPFPPSLHRRLTTTVVRMR